MSKILDRFRERAAMAGIEDAVAVRAWNAVQLTGDGKQPKDTTECFAAAVMPGEVDDEKRTANCVFYSGATVARLDWWTGEKYFLTLSLDKKHVRMDRLNSGAPVLDSHSNYAIGNVLGVIENAQIKDGKGTASMRFSARDEVEPVWLDVKDGILRNVSMGVQIHKLQDVTPNDDKLKSYLAVDWEPMEVSIVGVPADPGAGFLSAQLGRIDLTGLVPPDPELSAPARGEQPRKESLMETTTENAGNPPLQAIPPAIDEAKLKADAVAGEQLRQKSIRDACSVAMRHCPTVDEAFQAEMIDGNVSLESVRTKIFEKMAQAGAAAPKQNPHVVPGRDEADTQQRLMRASILYRHNPGAIETYGYKADEGREYAGYSLIEMARICLKNSGVRGTERMSKMDIANQALSSHTTSDFPNLLSDSANKTLRAGYEEVPRTFLPLGRRATLPDFKNMNRLQLGELPALPKVNENGEYKATTLGEGKEAYRLYTYGHILNITRQAIINDDLDAFTRIPAQQGAAAARTESNIFWAIITANAAMADGVALFHATHSNLAAAVAVISVTSVGAGRGAMRKQTGLDGATILNISPAFLVGPAALETTMEQLVAVNLLPATTAAVVPATIRSLTPIAEPRLDANSLTAWYLFSAPGRGGVETIEYAYLEGNEGVRLESRPGWTVDGMELKVSMDFGAKALDHRGMYKNPGA